jgi:hypothetical protein
MSDWITDEGSTARLTGAFVADDDGVTVVGEVQNVNRGAVQLGEIEIETESGKQMTADTVVYDRMKPEAFLKPGPTVMEVDSVEVVEPTDTEETDGAVAEEVDEADAADGEDTEPDTEEPDTTEEPTGDDPDGSVDVAAGEVETGPVDEIEIDVFEGRPDPIPDVIAGDMTATASVDGYGAIWMVARPSDESVKVTHFAREGNQYDLIERGTFSTAPDMDAESWARELAEANPGVTLKRVREHFDADEGAEA